jgi:hypothetical protein
MPFPQECDELEVEEHFELWDLREGEREEDDA